MGEVNVLFSNFEQFSYTSPGPSSKEKLKDTCEPLYKKDASEQPPARFDTKSSNSTESTPAKPVSSVAKEAVCTMGIPEVVVQMAIDLQNLEGGSEFENAMQLYMVADDLYQHPEKQSRIVERLFEAEQVRKRKENQLNSEAQKRSVVDSKPSKAELQEKVKKLAKENYKLKQRKVCRACKKTDLASSGVTFLPCGHFITCEICSETFDDCPACGKTIMGTVRTFLS